MERVYCPITKSNVVCNSDEDTHTKRCAWYCAGEEACALKVIALQLIKLEEKE